MLLLPAFNDFSELYTMRHCLASIGLRQRYRRPYRLRAGESVGGAEMTGRAFRHWTLGRDLL